MRGDGWRGRDPPVQLSVNADHQKELLPSLSGRVWRRRYQVRTRRADGLHHERIRIGSGRRGPGAAARVHLQAVAHHLASGGAHGCVPGGASTQWTSPRYREVRCVAWCPGRGAHRAPIGIAEPRPRWFTARDAAVAGEACAPVSLLIRATRGAFFAASLGEPPQVRLLYAGGDEPTIRARWLWQPLRSAGGWVRLV